MRDIETIDSELRLVTTFAVQQGSGAGRCRRSTWRMRCWMSAPLSARIACRYPCFPRTETLDRLVAGMRDFMQDCKAATPQFGAT
jgi:hypothetical protein